MTERLVEFDYFRGLSIFFIIFGHITNCLGEIGFIMNGYAGLYKMIPFTVHGGTAFFVFISGFMFYWIYYQRGFRFRDFLRSKFKNVFAPYFLIASIFSIIHIIYGVYTGRLTDWNFAANFVTKILANTYMYWAFWYVPFIMLVFALSPLYLKFVQLKSHMQIVLLILCLIASCFIGRNNLNSFQSCAYFSVYYLFGITCAQNYKLIKNFSVKFYMALLWLYLILIFFATLSCKFYFENLHFHLPYISERIIYDFTPLFKIPECLLILWAINKIANLSEMLRAILPIMAKYSFAIFFLHNFLIMILEETFFWANIEHPLQHTAWLYPVGFVMAVIVCKICILIAKFLKGKIGVNSRMFIGV